MALPANGLAKLAEECGELVQVIGKKLAYYATQEHPDGGPPLDDRLRDEMADVMAAIGVVAEIYDLDKEAFFQRAEVKRDLFMKWHEDPANATDAIDAGRSHDSHSSQEQPE